MMKYEDVPPGQVERYLISPLWAVEQKMDGTRGLAVITKGGVIWPYGERGEGRLAHSAATQWLPRIDARLLALVADHEDAEIVLDGEIMIHTGEYRVFDVPYLRIGGREWVVPGDALSQRRIYLETIGAALHGAGPVTVTSFASTEDEKRALLAAVEAAGGEGVVFKRLTGSYQPGRRTGDVLKFKFTYSVDVVVIERKTSPNSITFGVYDEAGVLRTIGSCSMIGKPHVGQGDVVEVMCLYWTGTSLYQPRMVRQRFDKMPRDCTTAQLRAYSRDAAKV